VHGVRSLALSEHVQATGTQARIDALVAAGPPAVRTSRPISPTAFTS
jgi:signal-transduction protein with cAMP-binding, CBS, and nucleotidyltransferase domain